MSLPRPGKTAFEAMVAQNERYSNQLMFNLGPDATRNLYLPYFAHELPNEETLRILPGSSLLLIPGPEGRMSNLKTGLPNDTVFEIVKPLCMRSVGSCLFTSYGRVGETKQLDAYAAPGVAYLWNKVLTAGVLAVDTAKAHQHRLEMHGSGLVATVV